MRILINPKHFKKERFDVLINSLPNIIFTDDINDHDIEGIITWSSAIKAEVLDRYPKLKIVLLPSAGYDKADLNYLKKREIILTNARGVYDIQIAEDVISKIMYFNRDIKQYQTQMNHHIWEADHHFHELYQKTVGIIGTGSIGMRIAQVLRGFNTRVIGFKRTKDDVPYFDHIYTEDEGFNDLLKQSDYVILAVPLTDETTHIIDENALRNMKKDALLINIARGKIVDEKALIKALNSDWIRGAALDVTETEPLPENHPLWQAKNIFITPHIAGTSPMANLRVNERLKQIIEQYVHKIPIDNRIC